MYNLAENLSIVPQCTHGQAAQVGGSSKGNGTKGPQGAQPLGPIIIADGAHCETILQDASRISKFFFHTLSSFAQQA